MTMTKLSLHSPLHGWEKGQYPTAPFVYLSVGNAPEVNGVTVLSTQMATDTEVDYAVDSLVTELEQLRKFAKAELVTLQSRMLRK
jgi:hypothetical protein